MRKFSVMEGKESVCDDVLEALAHSDGVVVPNFTHEEARATRAELNAIARSSVRYYLDDETTQMISELGTLQPQLLYYNLDRARLPFPRIVVDYSPAAFVRGGGREPASNAPNRSAFCIERIGSGTLFRMTPFGVLKGTQKDGSKRSYPLAMLNVTSVKFDVAEPLAPIEDVEAMLVGSVQRRLEKVGISIQSPEGMFHAKGPKMEFDSARHVVRTSVLGSVDRVRLPEDEQKEHARQMRELRQHSRIELTPVSAGAYRRVYADMARTGKADETMDAVVAESILEFAGQWRFAITFLMLLNAQDYTSEHTFRLGAKPRIKVGKVVPFLEHRLVSLKLPRKIVRTRMIQHLGEALPRRRHMVAGHWRHRVGVGDLTCQHVFTDLTERSQKCELCGYHRWRVDEHERGDASLGYVTKDYVVET